MRASFLALALVAAGVAQAQVDYTVSYGNPAEKLSVTLEFAASPNGTAVRMPNWAPGAYVLRDNFAAVQNLNVTVDGQAVQATNDKDRWAIPARSGQRVRVTYAVPTSKDVTRRGIASRTACLMCRRANPGAPPPMTCSPTTR